MADDSAAAGWRRVDDYLADSLLPTDDALDHALATSAAAGLPAIQVSATQGAFLRLLVRLTGARRVLEIGTLGGYSAIWLAGGLPAGGRLVSLEVDPRHADVARANLVRAGLAEVSEIRVGPALQTLPGLASEPAFDLTFIDADKESCEDYVRWALRLSRPGAVIVVDNVVRAGAVADPDSADPRVLGVRRMITLLSGEARLSSTALQTVGAKGYDGFSISLVEGPPTDG